MNPKIRKQQQWQAFKQTHKRIYGSLSNAEYRQMKIIADNNDRPLWRQIWLESCAYRQRHYLPSEQLEQRLTQLRIDIRKIGTNLNQIARHSNRFKQLLQQRQLLKNLQRLETELEQAVRDVTHPRHDY